ncbi:YdcF family protein [Niameybacter massiliensis]|uniref:YdcF family protein n=1 Tax=Niameybacter massiliensis TaxID=1658108 RepID=UPI0006B649C2|nr:YdcF family protein [Niameybacter massiliensis]
MKTIDDITNYIFLEHPLEKADIIFIPGGSYAELGEQAARLWCNGYAPFILPSGKYSPSRGYFPGPLSKANEYNKSYTTEWAFFQDVLLQNGVSETAILREDLAEYTYQNAFKSKEVTDALGLQINKAILCCKSFHARRCYTYYQWAYPHTTFIICPVDIQGISKDTWFQTEVGIDKVLGELARCGSQFKTCIMQSICNENKG